MADHGLREAVSAATCVISIWYSKYCVYGITSPWVCNNCGKIGAKEIDFICQKQEQKIYVQVTYLLASEETIQREFGIYESVRDNFLSTLSQWTSSILAGMGLSTKILENSC
mgnify:CR=1 FL=1